MGHEYPIQRCFRRSHHVQDSCRPIPGCQWNRSLRRQVVCWRLTNYLTLASSLPKNSKLTIFFTLWSITSFFIHSFASNLMITKLLVDSKILIDSISQVNNLHMTGIAFEGYYVSSILVRSRI